MTQTPTVPPIVNRTMKYLLRSPMHGVVSKSVLLISFTGKNSGKTYTTPVSYSRNNDLVFIFTHADWWKNLLRDPRVTLRIQGQELHGIAEAIAEDKRAIAAGLASHLKKVPSDARYYGVTLDERGTPKFEEVEKAVQTVVMIRIELC